MSRSQPYQALNSGPSDLPSFPPNYEDVESNLANEVGNSTSQGIEQFEVEDGYTEEDNNNSSNSGLLSRASFMTKKFASNFNNKVIHPVSQIIDPIYEGYKYLQDTYEKSLLKLGNPLVVKRLLYVIFIMGFIYFMTKYTQNEGISGASGGAFSTGKFYDIDKLGKTIREYIDPKSMEENLEYFSSMPHLAGSKGDLTYAKYIVSYMANNGIKNMDFNELQSNINYPVFNDKQTYVKLSDGSFQAKLYETDDTDMQYLSFNPNSLNTNEPIESVYIYGNYGSEEDFKQLVESKMNLKDVILLLNYGGSMPDSNKVKVAQQLQIKAIIFISPEIEAKIGEDNTIKYDGYIQRQNMGLNRMNPGDVLTPGWSSEDGYVSRLPWFRSDITPKIPTIPISYVDGLVFLSKLGKNGIKYKNGFYSGIIENGPKIQLGIKNDQRPTHPLWNVVGSIQGREQAEKGIIIGATRDSLGYGAISANTGTTLLVELIKIFTSLQRHYNWIPARTIYFISFDATEYNLAGSAEWIQNRKDQLKQQGYAYIDLSDAISGDTLSIKSNPFFHKLIRDTLKKVQSDETNNINLYELYKKQHNGKDDISNNMIEQKNYIPFINLVNVPAIEIKFSGKKYPKNSCYDTFENFNKLNIDPLMTKHTQLLELISLIVLELVEKPIIPYDFNGLASSISKYQSDLDKYFKDLVKDIKQKNIPQMHLESIGRANDVLKATGRRFDEWVGSWDTYVKDASGIEPSLLAMNRWKWNDNMVEFNQMFISQDASPKRPGYINLLFGVPYSAPEEDNGKYEWNTFPSIRDYAFEGDFGRAQHEIDQLSNLLLQASEQFLDL
ncbi:uncharacterized protein RJT21DRAFT_120609 [Scheffersomyces amazonensis]|uniref:uncharacterized protein n=1 Tax=Scheffersomyces amazonensis TaxID=1078765 RepID=UPI00315CB450